MKKKVRTMLLIRISDVSSCKNINKMLKKKGGNTIYVYATQRLIKEALELINNTQTDHDDRHSLCQDFLTW